jgi:signal transduction histidine kinase
VSPLRRETLAGRRARWRSSSQVAHSVRVAVIAALLIAVLYVALTVVFDTLDAKRLVADVDRHLSERLVDASRHGSGVAPPGEADDDRDIDVAPVVLWRVSPDGRVTALSDNAPALPARSWSPTGVPRNGRVGNGEFRLRALRNADGWLVAGQSLADTEHVESVLVAAEVIAGPILVVAMFLGALVIGLKASGPVEQARLRQLEFTADASHELRTPLSVIEAEVSLALSAPRDATSYKGTLERVSGEGARLRRTVEDLLWLARFDSEPPAPGHEPVDVAAVAAICTDRFSAVASARGVTLDVRSEGESPALVDAPPEWIDRLTGVLVDNACRYAGPGGVVRVVTASQGSRVSLVVQDTGPGIPPEERPRLFDRFHRSTTGGGGAGLGLAIADTVVRGTGGRWRVADAPGGGAHMEVSWHRVAGREPEAQASKQVRSTVEPRGAPAGGDETGDSQVPARPGRGV